MATTCGENSGGAQRIAGPKEITAGNRANLACCAHATLDRRMPLQGSSSASLGGDASPRLVWLPLRRAGIAHELRKHVGTDRQHGTVGRSGVVESADGYLGRNHWAGAGTLLCR